ncbi:MAG: glycoside hydrolase family 127 protein, partial [Muribaculaceae bacterium]|nr:glycoside hydrolase family 127 protein [Muribaculaceae bacterium]
QSGAHKVYSTPDQSFWCCVGSGFESHAKYAESIYYRSGDRLFVNLFIPSQLTWKEKGLVMTQHTDFPESETTRLTIDEAPAAAITLSLRYPGWSGLPVVRVNGRKVKVSGAPSSYIDIKRRWRKGDTVEVTYPMSIKLETTPDNPARGALVYGPVVLAGNLGTESMQAPAPFSDPAVRNDYYTYDYHIPAGLPTHLVLDKANPGACIERTSRGLKFRTRSGVDVLPLYDAHRMRYVVYWDIDYSSY